MCCCYTPIQGYTRANKLQLPRQLCLCYSLDVIPVPPLYQDVPAQVEEVDRCTAVRHAGSRPAGPG